LQRFERSLIRSHCAQDGQFSPEFIGSVELGESFVVETENSNDANGPIYVEDVKAGEPICVAIEDIEIVGPVLAPNGGPLDGFAGFELEMRHGYLYFPEHFRIRPRPTLGNVVVLPSEQERQRLLDWTANVGYTPKRWRQLVNDPGASTAIVRVT
jgi:acetamidase/formamidase